MCTNQKPKTNREKANLYVARFNLIGCPPMFEFEFSADPTDQTTVILIKYNHEFNRSKTTITIPDFVTEIGDLVFANYKDIETLKLDTTNNQIGTIKIGKLAFTTCDKLHTIIVNNQNISNWQQINNNIILDDGVFGGCVALNISNIPTNAKPLKKSYIINNKCYIDDLQTNTKIELPHFYYVAMPREMRRYLLFCEVIERNMPFDFSVDMTNGTSVKITATRFTYTSPWKPHFVTP